MLKLFGVLMKNKENIMTVQELYDYCKERGVTDFEIFINEISVNGCFIGYEKLTPDEIDIGYAEKMITF